MCFQSFSGALTLQFTALPMGCGGGAPRLGPGPEQELRFVSAAATALFGIERTGEDGRQVPLLQAPAADIRAGGRAALWNWEDEARSL